MLDKLYEIWIHSAIWNIVKNLNSGLTPKIKWKGGISSSFNIQQGVKQRGVLSTHLYKIYNNLLQVLGHSNFGLNIGNIYAGCPTCADDIALLSSNPEELQCMLEILHRHSRKDRVTINPIKTKAMILN